MLLQNIHSPEDLKKLSEDSLTALASEIRRKILDVVGKNGGHLASNLGIVELTIALHRVFNSPEDAIVWDVSHQSYPHKLLTGRYDAFPTIRLKDGLSGFTRISESPHDYFDAGHSSSSISSALGLLAAWRLQGRNDKVVAVIGDGALTGGMAFEALSHAGQLSKNLIVVLNDNQMSISPNTGAISRYLSKLSMSRSYQELRHKIDRAVDLLPNSENHLGKFIYRFKRGLKGLLLTNNLFVDLGFEYVGPLDGHNIRQMEAMFKKVSKIPRPVVVHVVTKKGRGYSPAENDPATFHGIGPFNTSDGVVEKFDALSFTEAFSSKMLELGKKDSRITAVTAAMAKGTGLDAFSRRYKERFFDVGIAEEHAVTFAGALAAGGMIPVVAIYSTFMQRSTDQVIEDVALQNRHVVFALDRAGAVPGDGETHQGIFDIALFRSVPNITMLSPVSQKDLDLCMDWAVFEAKGPVMLRWPKLSCPSEIPAFSAQIEPGRGLHVKNEEFAPAVSTSFMGNLVEQKKSPFSVLLVCTGGIYTETLTAARSLLLKGISTDIFILRFIKPFDENCFLETAKGYDYILVVEDGILEGGIGEYISRVLLLNGKKNIDVIAFPDKFCHNGNREQILEDAGPSPENIAERVIQYEKKRT